MSKLQDSFVNHFKRQQYFTTKEAFEWYRINKSNADILPPRCAVHQLIINPLLHRGSITKISRGVYLVNAVNTNNNDDLDEFDKYVANKLKGGV